MSDKNKHKKYGKQKKSEQNQIYVRLRKDLINKARRLARMFNNGENLKQVRSAAHRLSMENASALKEGVRLYNKAAGASVDWTELAKKPKEEKSDG